MTPNNDPYNQNNFLLSEYDNVSQAHFKSIETISSFFRYYLLIMSIPLTAMAFFYREIKQEQALQLKNIINQNQDIIWVVLIAISLVGLGVFCYIVNLRLDVILYARAVNGIRKYFYDQLDLDINLKLRTRVLPQSPQLPPYLEKSFFVPVAGVFAILNTLYYFFGTMAILANPPLLYILSGVIFVDHFLIYWCYSRHRETGYLKSNIIGVDIDGVLNKHREHFCDFLFEKTGKKINPEQITIIPANEHPSLGITRSHEREIFNDPKYWDEMPVIEGAVDNIKKLQNVFKLKIYLFTHRPWPDADKQEEVLRYNQQFRGCIKDPTLKDKELLRQMTIEWLRKSGFIYNKFFFEKGNDYSSDPRGEFRNRFYIARKKKIRFFIDDDYEKAIKLSYICDIVFLYSHPYNERDNSLSEDINKLRENLPSNVVRVKNWDEIYKGIRRFS